MSVNSLQVVRTKFDLTRDQEKMLWRYINNSLRYRSIKVKQSKPISKQDARKDLRVTFEKPVFVLLEFAQTKSLPAQKIKAKLIDLSMGGCCLGIEPIWQVEAGWQGSIKMSITDPPLDLQATVLEVDPIA